MGKNFVVEYYTCTITPTMRGGCFEKMVEIARAGSTLQDMPNRYVGFRELAVSPSGGIITGVFAKYRKDNLPHIGSMRSNNEHELELLRDQALIEKNYFLMARNPGVIVYQRNGNASYANTMAQHLAYLLGAEETVVTVDFNPVLDPEEIDNILSRGTPKNIEFTVANPNPRAVGNNASDFDHGLLNVLETTGGFRVRFKITPDRGGFLGGGGVRRLARQIFRGYDTITTAKAEMLDESGDFKHPVNLLTRSITDTIQVRMNGRYPDPESIRAKLMEAYNGRRDFLIRELAS